jgi:hypothetical protein
MNNEPVAWIEPDVIPLTHIIKAVVRREQDEQYSIPLYTHPVKDKPHPKCDEACMYLCQMRELTDEEIIAVGNAVVNHIDSNEGWIEFARAILRKAQEKC